MQVATQRNSELQTAGSIKLPVGDTQRLEVALRSPKIKDLSEQELSEILRWVMVKLGLREQNWPHPTEKILLINHIVENFGGNTGSEIKLAFEMAIARKLEDVNEKGEVFTVNPNCYENFSCLYFSGVMNAYRYWASQEKKYLDQSQKPKELPPVKSEPMTDDEFIQMNYETWKVLKNPMVIMVKEGNGAQSCFKILLDQGKIQRLEGEERDFVIKKATSDLHEIWRETGINLTVGEKEKEIRTLCKKYQVQKYFLTLNQQP